MKLFLKRLAGWIILVGMWLLPFYDIWVKKGFVAMLLALLSTLAVVALFITAIIFVSE